MRVKNKLKIAVVLLFFILIINSVNAEITKQESYSYLYSAKKSINELEELSYSTARLNDLLAEAESAYSSKDYNKVVTLSNNINALKLKAIELNDKLEKADSVINDAKLINLTVINAEPIFNSASREFEIDDYELSESLIEQAYQRLVSDNKEEFSTIKEKLNFLKDKSEKAGLNIIKIKENIQEADIALKTDDYRKLIIIIKDIKNLENTIDLLVNAKESIKQMSNNNLSTARVNDVFQEVLFSLESSDYNNAARLCSEITDLKEKAFNLNIELKQIESKIYELKQISLDVSEAELLFEEAKYKFSIDNYEDASTLLKESYDKLEYIEAKSLLFGVVSKNELKLSAVSFFKRYWPVILIVLVALTIAIIILYKAISKILLRNKIKRMEKEEKILIDLIKQSQRDYYKDKIISKQTYYIRTDKYQERIIKIKEKLPVLKDKLDKRKESETQKQKN